MSDQMSPQNLRELFEYRPGTGDLIRKIPMARRHRAGDIAGHTKSDGYKAVVIRGKQYLQHRVAWAIFYGVHPLGQIDHINGIRGDNRICNLRDCTRSDNYQNKARYRNNSSGFTGVTWHPPNKAWLARIGINKKKVCLGYFATPESAYEAYLSAKRRLHKFQPIPRELTT